MRSAHAIFAPVVIWCLLTSHVAHAYSGKSWEPCSLQSHCVQEYICAKGVVGADDTYKPYSACYYEDFNATTCFCLPFGTPQACTSSADCNTYEVCALQTGLNQSSYCVSCYGLGIIPFRFQPVDDNDPTCNSLPSPTPFPTVTPTAKPSALSYVLDFCNVSGSCDDGSLCRNMYEVEAPCSEYDSLCQCGSPPYESCKNSSECDAGTACALDVRNGTNICVSCAAIAQRTNFIPVDQTGKECQMVDPIPSPPSSFPANNGQTMDSCRSDLTCADGRYCSEFTFDSVIPCQEDIKQFCMCLPPSSLIPCTSSSNCTEAEGCASFPGVSGPHCYSLKMISILGPELVKMFGDKELPRVSNPGFAGASCRFDWECAEQQRCTHRSEVGVVYGECAGRSQCICESLVSVRCITDEDCKTDEVCAKIVGARTSPTCRSAIAVAEDPIYERVDATDEPDESPEDDDQHISPETSGLSGLSGDKCFDDSDCVSGICRHVTEMNSTCDRRDGCVCAARSSSCAGDNDCENGEQCVLIKDQFLLLVPAKCLSESAVDRRRAVYVSYASVMTPTPSPSMIQAPAEISTSDSAEVSPSADPDSCIDAKALTHFPIEDLVFKDPRRAAVLCDSDGSCATPGHIVEWNGTPMMMQSYCAAIASCSRRVLWVNSPRMGAGLRVGSRTDGLKFTALAARYKSRFEEHALRVLLRIGL